MLRAYKAELNPNNIEKGFFRRCAGVARYVYNYALAESRRRYDAGEKGKEKAAHLSPRFLSR